MDSNDDAAVDRPVPISRWPEVGELSRRAEDTTSGVALAWSPDAEVALIAAAEAGQTLFAEQVGGRFVVSTTRLIEPTDPQPGDIERQGAGPARNALDALCCAILIDSEHPWSQRVTGAD